MSVNNVSNHINSTYRIFRIFHLQIFTTFPPGTCLSAVACLVKILSNGSCAASAKTASFNLRGGIVPNNFDSLSSQAFKKRLCMGTSTILRILIVSGDALLRKRLLVCRTCDVLFAFLSLCVRHLFRFDDIASQIHGFYQ